MIEVLRQLLNSGAFTAIVSAICLWVGWLIKSRIDQREKKKTTEGKLESKLNALLNLEVQEAKARKKEMAKLKKGLELCMEDDDIIFEAFRNSGLLNGKSEVQSAKLYEFKKELLEEGLNNDTDPFDGVSEYSEIIKKL